MADDSLTAQVGAKSPRAPVVLTRPAGQNAALAACLRERGRVVLELPALQLTALAVTPPDPAGFDLVVFVSGNAVRMFLDARHSATGPLSWPAGVPAATVGPSSAAALRAHAGFGAMPDILQPAADAASFDSESLWQELERLPVMPQRVLLVRGGVGQAGSGRDWLAGRLRAAGADVTVHCAYRREPAAWEPDASAFLLALATTQQTAIWLFTSREGVDAVHDQLRSAGLLDWFKRCRLIATHARIAEHLIAVMGLRAADFAQPMLLISSPQDGDIFAAIESTP